MKKTAFILFLTSFLSLRIFSAYGGTIRGILHDNKNKPQPFSTVMLLGAGDSVLYKGEVTNDKGEFIFEQVKEGEFFIRIHVTGFKEIVSGTLRISQENPTVDLGILISEPQSTDLGQVIVKADKPFIERQTDKLIVNIENSSVQTGSSVMEVIEKLPGVLMDQNDNIGLKGKQGALIFVDGKPTGLSGENLSNMLRGLPSNSIQKIEIITNPSAKYDAAGNAGIINIIMKKNRQDGFNGTISAGYGQGRYGKFNTALNLSYKHKWYNLFLNYSYSKRKGFINLLFDRTVLDTNNIPIVMQTNNYSVNPSEVHNPRVGIDFYLSKKTTLSVLGSGISNHFKPTGAANTFSIDAFNNSIGNTRFTNQSNDKWYNYSFNTELKTQLDTSGQELTISMDYANYWNITDQIFTTVYNTNENIFIKQNNRIADQDGSLKLSAFKTDYTLPLKKFAKLDMGIKSSYVVSKNKTSFYDEVNTDWIFSTPMSSHFNYSENINAAYLNLNKDIKKVSIQLGLRAEQTIAKGEQLLNHLSFNRNYFKVFPTVFIDYKINEKHNLNLTAGRRIGRPEYSQLTPFKRMLDPQTYSEGNPGLLPEFTYNVELTYSYKNTIFINPSYSITKNNISDLLFQDGQTTTQMSANFPRNYYAGLNLIFSKRLTNWWTTNTSFLLFHNAYKGAVNGENVNTATPSFSANTNNSFSIRDGLSMECSFKYSYKCVYGITLMREMYNLTIGIQKALFKKRVTLTLNATDVLWKNYFGGVTTTKGVNQRWDFKRDSRVVNVNVSYKFGKGKVGKMRRQTAADEEKQRIQTN